MRIAFQVCVFHLAMLIVTHVAFADHGREILPKSWQWDATINDVFALNDKTAWAVGDQGLILRTTDGGESWLECQGVGLDLDDNRSLKQKLGNMRPISQTHELQPLTCSFKSVFFLNEKRGWVVGNYFVPYLQSSRSVILTTNDGGKNWYQFKANLLPQISRIHFQDVLGGWAIGNTGSLFNSGVFATSTGGRSWSVQNVEPARNWIDGELIPDGFVVIDDEGIIGRIVGKSFEPAVVFGMRPGRLRSVRMLDREIGWAVGHNGTVLQTDDGGQSWKRPENLENDSRILPFDFSTLSIREGRVWIAGNPGSTVISFNAKTGDQISFHLTGGLSPIQKLYFESKLIGWAVGSQGRIIATTDGGQNWRTQRSSNDRAAVMVVSTETSDLPWALLSYYSNEHSRLSSMVLLGKHASTERDLARRGVNRLGCSTVIELLGDDLNAEKPEKYSDSILMELVRSIRTVRPNVLVCNQVPGLSDNELHVLCRTAIDMSANSKVFTKHMTELALESWQVDRYLIRQSKTADINFAASRYLPKSGSLLEDQIAISRALVGQSIHVESDESYRVESFTGSISAKRDDVFFGLRQLGREVPTREKELRLGNLNSIATAPLKRTEFKRLLSMPLDSSEDLVLLKRQIRSFATGIEAHETGIWMMQLAESFLNEGKTEFAAFALEEMIGRYGDHALTPAALMWLAQYYSSDEVMASLVSQERLKNGMPDTNASDEKIQEAIEADESKFFFASPNTTQQDGVRLVSWEVDEPTSPRKDANDNESSEFDADLAKEIKNFRTQRASHYLARLKQYDLDFAQNERVQFMEAMILHKIPGDIANQNLLKRIKRTTRIDSDFVYAVSRELRSRDDRARLEVNKCFYTDVRPQLDGVLDDDLWQLAAENGFAKFKPMTPRNKSESVRNDTCWLHYDDEFLFVAVRCNRLDNFNYDVKRNIRERDLDLFNHDRIQIGLDFDRDLQSQFLFEVDHRGFAFESCAGAKGWNPEWFIAVSGDAKAWTVELAIPLREIVSVPVEELSVAAFSFKRLDSKSTDLWSTDKYRQPVKPAHGIVSGLKIDPKGFELLEFVNSNAEEDGAAQLR